MKPLTAADLVIGERYVPHTKSVWGTLEESKDWKDAKEANQPYLYYTGLLDGYHCFSRLNDDDFDLFLPSDVTPYVEGNKQTAVEWLVEQLLFKDHSNPLIQQALQMEREQTQAAPDLLKACEELIEQVKICNYNTDDGHLLLWNKSYQAINAIVNRIKNNS